jgi:hypothetical protein
MLADTEAPELFSQDARVRKRMAAVPARGRPGEVAVQVQEAGAWYVGLAVGALARRRFGEVVATVEHDPARVRQAGGESSGGHQRRMRHDASLTPKA